MGIDLFESFSEWLDKKKERRTKNLEKAVNTAYHNWDAPDVGDYASVSAIMPESFKDIFKREDIQEAYASLLVTEPTSETPRSDAIGIKLQNGIMAAYEQAYRLRHATTPRLLATALNEDKRWKEDSVPFLLKKRIEFLRALQTEDKEGNKK